MIILPGYNITEIIYEGLRTVVYRGIRENDRQPVIVKTIKDEYPTIEQITRLRQEYIIIQNLDVQGIVKPYCLETYQNSFALVLEDFGGRSINQLLTQKKNQLKEVLQIAISLTETLDRLHKIPIIHKDIKPSNIIINPETREVKLTDFSIAIALPKEQPTIVTSNLLEGTIAYMSPEQTGRMNRTLDYRSDLYSFGVTLYELLTGELPFTSQDVMSLIYCHIAKQPVPPCQIKSNLEAGSEAVPQVVSDIVMKLLEKNAEDRYQSAAGLKFDLEACLRQLETTGEITNFPLATRDRGNQLFVPQKLYGRESEVATLLAAFKRVAGHSQSKTELVLVSGYSGIGKTSIVNEVHKPIVEARGYFIAGKFDQFKRDIPYAALIQAFGELMRQLLTESEEEIADWKAKLLEALGSNGQIIIDVIPEVELIIDSQPKVPQVGGLEAQNRFNRVFQQFVRVFCQPQHPLVIFLDDLQWADSASLKLMELLTTDEGSQYLLIIGAYRDNEVSPTHPLIQTVEKIQATEAVVNNITIEPLSLVNVNQLVAETLNANVDGDKLKQFSELVFSKTQGNPFFLTQLLKTLYAEDLLVYQIETGSWQWDLDEIQAIGITDCNVVELMVRNLRKLSKATQKVLKLAACIGNQFNLEVLSIVNEESDLVTAANLWEALQSGLILPIGDNYKIPLVFAQEELAAIHDVKVDYKFLHDRVQQAAYSLIPKSEKKAIHLKTGQLLLKNTTPQERKDNVFALVNQLNFGTDLLTTQSEKEELAELNLIAGQKAKSSTAYEASVNYLNVGLKLLSQDSWERQYELTFCFYVEVSEAEYLNTNIERAETLCDLALEKVKTILDEVKLYEIKIKLSLAKNQIKAAVNTGLQILDKLEVTLSQSPPSDMNFEELTLLPRMTDLSKLAAIKILTLIHRPASFGASELVLPIIYTMLELSKQYGNSPSSIYAYSIYSILVAFLIPDIDLAEQLRQFSLQLLDHLNAKEFLSQVLVGTGINIQHRKEHIRETIDPLQVAIQSALDVGDIEYACHAANFYCSHLFYKGEYLVSLQDQQKKYVKFIGKFKQEHQFYLANIIGQLVANLLGNSGNRLNLNGEFINEEEILPYFQERNNFIALFNIYFCKCVVCYLFKEFPQALEAATIGETYTGILQSEIIFIEHNFYYSLSLLAQENQIDTREEYLKKVADNQEKMKYWAHHAPMNYQHKYDLVEAEKARV